MDEDITILTPRQRGTKPLTDSEAIEAVKLSKILNLAIEKSVKGSIRELIPSWPSEAVRNHLISKCSQSHWILTFEADDHPGNTMYSMLLKESGKHPVLSER